MDTTLVIICFVIILYVAGCIYQFKKLSREDTETPKPK